MKYDYDRPPLHVIAFYCCVLLIHMGSMKWGWFLDRVFIRYYRLTASMRRRVRSSRATGPAVAPAGLKAGFVRNR